jgi:hypothetical protein
MKTLLSVVKTLIKINVVMAFASLLVFAVMREQQVQTTDNRQKISDSSQSYHTAMKAKTTAEQEQLETSNQKIVQHEQQIKKLEGELEAYKTRVNDLLFDKTGVQSNTPSTQKTDLEDNHSLSPQMQPSSPLLDRIVKSGQSTISNQNLKIPAPYGRPFDRAQIERKVTTSVASHSPRENKSAKIENSQLQPTAPWTHRVVRSLKPSGSLPNTETNVQAKPSNRNSSSKDIALDTRALFTAQSPHEPLDSFVTPTQPSRKESAVSSRVAALAQQLSRKANNNSLYRSGNQSNDEPNEHLSHANDIVVGLIVADEKGQINYGTNTYRQVQTAIRILRQGKDINDAARGSKLPPSVLQQLIKWGENRPGNLSELSEISRVSPEVR